MSEQRACEEQAAQRLWEQIERLRQGEPVPPPPPAGAPGEAEELAALAKTAVDLAAWMETEGDSAARRDRVRRRMWARIDHAGLRREARGASRIAPWRPAPGARRLAFLAAAAVLLAALLLPRIGRAPVTDLPPAAGHDAVVRDVRQLVNNTMSPEETRAAWRHILECPGCFDLYKKAWHQERGRADSTWRLVSTPRR